MSEEYDFVEELEKLTGTRVEVKINGNHRLGFSYKGKPDDRKAFAESLVEVGKSLLALENGELEEIREKL